MWSRREAAINQHGALSRNPFGHPLHLVACLLLLVMVRVPCLLTLPSLPLLPLLVQVHWLSLLITAGCSNLSSIISDATMLASILTQQLAQSKSNSSAASLTPFKTHSASPSLRCSSDSVGLSGCRRGQMQHMGALVSNKTADPALRG